MDQKLNFPNLNGGLIRSYFKFMITHIDIDIVKQPSDALIHQANTQCIFGAGVALRIKNYYPEAYAADCKTIKGDIEKLGTYSVAQSKKDGKHIYNLYAQHSMGITRRHTNYEAFYKGLVAIRDSIWNLGLNSVSIPNGIGCRLGGGDFRIIKPMIEVVFENSAIDVYICNYQPS